MHLPPDFSFELLRKSGFDIDNSASRKNCLYKFILRNLYNQKIEDVNAFLKKNEISTLTQKL